MLKQASRRFRMRPEISLVLRVRNRTVIRKGKNANHPSRWSTEESFLDAVSPNVAVISCGRNNRYNHPHPEVLERLSRRGVRVFRTDRDGAVAVETDGQHLRVTPYAAE